MTRKITNTDLTKALLNVPNKFTVKEAAKHDDMFKRNSIGNALARYAKTRRWTAGVSIRAVGTTKQTCITMANGR